MKNVIGSLIAFAIGAGLYTYSQSGNINPRFLDFAGQGVLLLLYLTFMFLYIREHRKVEKLEAELRARAK